MLKIKQRAFTMIELMIVMAMIATIISIAMPRYFEGLERTKVTALKQNLNEMRSAISHYYDDKGQYPGSLQVLVTEQYLRFIPIDPITESAETWVIIPSSSQGVADVQSGALTNAKNGQPYSSW